MGSSKKPIRVEQNFLFRLVSVDTLKNYVNEKYSDEEIKNHKDITYRNQIQFQLSPAQEIVIVEINFTLWLNQDEKIELLSFSSASHYKTQKLADFLEEVKKGEYELTKNVANLLSELSLAHARGIHAYLIKDTKLKSFLIPFGNLSVFRHTQKTKHSA